MSTYAAAAVPPVPAEQASAPRPASSAAAPRGALGRLLHESLAWLRARGVGPVELGLFLMADLLLIALPVIGYFALRHQDPELFVWGRRLLNSDRGLIMTALLPAGGVALLAALPLSAAGRRCGRGLALLTAGLAGVAFLTVAAIDLDAKLSRRLVPGVSFRPNQRYVAQRFGVKLPRDWKTHFGGPRPASAAAPAAIAVREVSAKTGRELFMRVCASCHGIRGDGVAGSGVELRSSAFVKGLDDTKLAGFLKVGRQPWEAESKTKVQMPARGGDPRVSDDDLRDVVAYLREMQARAAPPASDAPAAAASAPSAAPASAPTAPDEEPAVLVTDRSFITAPPDGPQGLSAAFIAQRTRPRWLIPETAATYFRLFFAFTTIGALHVVLALAGVAALAVAALRAAPPAKVAPGLVLTTVGWWWATGCWTIAFGLMYALR